MLLGIKKHTKTKTWAFDTPRAGCLHQVVGGGVPGPQIRQRLAACHSPYHLLLSLLPPKPGLNPRTEPLEPPPAPQHVALGGPPGARVARRADITPGELPGGETLREGPWSPVAHFCPEAKGVQAAQASCPAPHGARGPGALAPPSPSAPRPPPRILCTSTSLLPSNLLPQAFLVWNMRTKSK